MNRFNYIIYNKILIFVFIFLITSCEKNFKIDLPNGNVVDKITIKELESVYQIVSYKQYKGFTIYDTNCIELEYTILTHNDLIHDVIYEEEIRKKKREKIYGFLTLLTKDSTYLKKVLICLKRLIMLK